MPRELVAIAPRTPVIRDYEEPALGPTEVRIRTELASPKHGTELVGYRNDPVASRPYDPAWGAVIPQDPSTALASFPRRLGNMAVGRVTETGPEVTRFQVGDRVFGHFPIRETQTVDQYRADRLPSGLTAEAALCLDPVVMALAIRDVNIRLGDVVAVFGLGAIGLVTLQLAKLAGAHRVIGVDPLANRRRLALSLGCDQVIDPAAVNNDPALAIRELVGPLAAETPRDPVPLIGGYREVPTQGRQLGVDVALETSGNTSALHQAIRATRYGGRIGMVSFYGREATGLLLGEEFHINRLELISVRAESLPLRDYPGWDLDRTVRLALDWLATGRIRTAGLIDPIVPFAESAEAYRAIDERPAESIKLGISFS
jgi:threonine dehydrogenase-like Zn-dependent dehydrogenase